MSEDYEPLDDYDRKTQQQLNQLIQMRNFEALLNFMVENSENYEFQIKSIPPNQTITNTLGIINKAVINQPPNAGMFKPNSFTHRNPSVNVPINQPPNAGSFKVNAPPHSNAPNPMKINFPPQGTLPLTSLKPMPINRPGPTMGPVQLNRIPLAGAASFQVRPGQLPLNGGGYMPIPKAIMNIIGANPNGGKNASNGLIYQKPKNP